MRNYASIDITNPTPRIPVVLVLDTSASMKGEPILELKKALQQFIRDISEDEAAGCEADVEKTVSGYMSKLEEIISAKEKELMSI